MRLKNAISPVVATALLLVVAVVAVVGFQGWFQTYQSDILVNTEQKSSTSNSLKIQGIVGDELYLYSGGESNLSSLKITSSDGTEMCSFSSSGEVNSSGLVGWWKLDDESSTITDYSGNGNDGKLYGSTRLLLDFDDGTADDRTAYENNGTLMNGVDCSGSGINGQSCSFDGVDDYINLGNDSSLNFLDNSFSISVWFNPSLEFNSSSLSSQGLITKSYSSSYSAQQYRLFLQSNTGKVVFIKSNGTLGTGIDGGNNDLVSSSQVNWNSNTWYNVIVSWDGTTNFNNMKLYINGLLDNQTTGLMENIANQIYDVYIGKESEQNNLIFNGSIDEVAIYSKALTDEEVQDLYNSQKAKFIEFKDSKLDKAVEFDGINDYIILSNDARNVFGSNPDEYSVLTILKNYDNTQLQSILNNYYSPNTGSDYLLGINMDIVSRKLRFSIRNGSNSFSLNSNEDLEVNKWIKSVSIFNKSSSNILFNYEGINFSTLIDNSVNYFDSNSLNLGALFWNNDFANFFNGQIDEVRIYNRTLTEEEISELYWNFISSNEEGINKIDLTSCNLNQGEKYNIVAFTNNQKAESYFIAK